MLALGLVAEWLGGSPLPAAVADLAVGWTLAAAGLVAWSRRPTSQIGSLIVLASFAWFVGALAGSPTVPLAAVGGVVVTLHRGLLIHALAAYPSGRLRGPARTTLVIAGYVWAAIAPIARSDVATLAMITGLIATLMVQSRRSGAARAARHAQRIAVVAALVLSAPLVVASNGRLAHWGTAVELAISWAYPAGVAVAAAILAVDLARAPWAQVEVTRLVVDLGDRATAGIRGRLAETLGDPSLEVAYWLPDRGGYVDERGEPVAASARPGRSVTMLQHDGERIGALVHDPTALEDMRLLEPVAAAARVALANVRLQADATRRLRELESSRARLLEADASQSERLQTVLRSSVGKRLADVGELIDAARAAAENRGNDAVTEPLADAMRDLTDARRDLSILASGMVPPELTELGLRAALAALTERSGLPVVLTVDEVSLPPSVESTLYFACAEALANIRKHTRATHVEVAVRVSAGAVALVVSDNGDGGAAPAAGSGLAGLRDRFAEVGGHLTIESPAGTGTRITGSVPLHPS
jgi:signal transduction histidine kinase